MLMEQVEQKVLGLNARDNPDYSIPKKENTGSLIFGYSAKSKNKYLPKSNHLES